MELNVETLAKLLTEAEEAHAEYEKSLGHPDPEWQKWYAEYLIERLDELISESE